MVCDGETLGLGGVKMFFIGFYLFVDNFNLLFIKP